MNIFGYVRVSDTGQNERRQLDAMTAVGVPDTHIYVDKQSGKDFTRTAYRRLLRKLKPGSLLYIESIDRLGRNYEEIQIQWRTLTKNMSIDIVVLDMELLDTRREKDLMGTFVADLTLAILSFIAQTELEHSKKRQTQGIAAARAQGIHLGRPAKILPENFMELSSLWACGRLTTKELLKQTGLPETTLYRRLRKHGIIRQK